MVRSVSKHADLASIIRGYIARTLDAGSDANIGYQSPTHFNVELLEIVRTYSTIRAIYKDEGIELRATNFAHVC